MTIDSVDVKKKEMQKWETVVPVTAFNEKFVNEYFRQLLPLFLQKDNSLYIGLGGEKDFWHVYLLPADKICDLSQGYKCDPVYEFMGMNQLYGIMESTEYDKIMGVAWHRESGESKLYSGFGMINPINHLYLMPPERMNQPGMEFSKDGYTDTPLGVSSQEDYDLWKIGKRKFPLMLPQEWLKFKREHLTPEMRTGLGSVGRFKDYRFAYSAQRGEGLIAGTDGDFTSRTTTTIRRFKNNPWRWLTSPGQIIPIATERIPIQDAVLRDVASLDDGDLLVFARREGRLSVHWLPRLTEEAIRQLPDENHSKLRKALEEKWLPIPEGFRDKQVADCSAATDPQSDCAVVALVYELENERRILYFANSNPPFTEWRHMAEIEHSIPSLPESDTGNSMPFRVHLDQSGLYYAYYDRAERNGLVVGLWGVDHLGKAKQQ